MNKSLLCLALGLTSLGAQANIAGADYQIRFNYTTAGSPANYVVPPGIFDGVASLTLFTAQGNFLCTGGLLGSGRHVLTAAHCVTDESGNLIADSASATFGLASGNVTVASSKITVNPGWNGDAFHGNDLAIIELAGLAPAEADRYGIYTGSGEIFSVADKAGYGRSGTGNSGDILNSGILRAGQNRYDSHADLFNGVFGISGIPVGTQLAYDFDNGLTANDAFAFYGNRLGVGSSLADLGLGLDEVSSAPGDSGGPSFIDGLLAGVTSYGLRLGNLPLRGNSDIDNALNSSFGEFSVDTRVAAYAGWINEVAPIPEPETYAMLLAGLGLIGLRFYRRKAVIRPCGR